MTVRIIFFVCVFSFSFTNLKAQDVEYTYDSNGNRETRTIVLNAQSKVSFDSDSTDLHKKDPLDVVVCKEPKVYPNPVQTTLFFVPSSEMLNKVYTLMVLDLSGNVIYKVETNNQQLEINFEPFAKGAYVLKVICESKKYDWKIIKM